MSCIVYRTDAAGRTYAYSSESYWDKNKKQSRSKRTYLGRVNPDTGQIIMGRQDGKNYKPIRTPDPTVAENAVILELQDTVHRLKDEISALKADNQKLNGQVSKMKTVCRNISNMTADMLRTM